MTQSSSTTPMKMILAAQIVGIGMLAWALVPSNPYGYYLLLRIVICGICTYLAFLAYARELRGWAWAIGATAIVYNPFFRIHLNREVWSVVNVATIALLAMTIFLLRGGKDPLQNPR